MRVASAVAAALFAREAAAGMFGHASPGHGCFEQFGEEARSTQVTIVDADAEDMQDPGPKYMQAHKWGRSDASEPTIECAPANPMTDNSQQPVAADQIHRYIVTKYNAGCDATIAALPVFEPMGWPDRVGVGRVAMQGKFVETEGASNLGALLACTGNIISQRTVCFAGFNEQVAELPCPAPQGGQQTMAPTAAPTRRPVAAATARPVTQQNVQCTDVPNFHAKDCPDCHCSWFADVPARCTTFGAHQGSVRTNGNQGNWHSANSACCVCSGGVQPATVAPSRAPRPAVPANGGVQGCTDKLGVNSEAFHLSGCDFCNCEWLAHDNRQQLYARYTGGVRDATTNLLMKPTDACCTCGGGQR